MQGQDIFLYFTDRCWPVRYSAVLVPLLARLHEPLGLHFLDRGYLAKPSPCPSRWSQSGPHRYWRSPLRWPAESIHWCKSRRGGKRQDKEYFRRLRASRVFSRRRWILSRATVTVVVVDLAGKAFFAKSVGVDKEGIVPSELVEFFIEVLLIVANVVLFYFLVWIFLVFPDGDRAHAVSQLPFLPEFGLSHIRVVVSHPNWI